MAKGRRPNKTGRNKGMGPFLALPYSVIDHPAFRNLPGAGRTVVIAIGRLYNGHNNGQLGFGERAGEKWGLSQKTTRRALAEATEAGFIRKVFAAGFNNKNRASEWAICWQQKLAEGVTIPEDDVFHSGKFAGARGKNGRYRPDDTETFEGEAVEITAIPPASEAA